MIRFLSSLRTFLLLPVAAAALSAGAASDEIWTDNPWAQVTIFGSGPLGSRLETAATLGSETDIRSLFHLDAITLPSELESFAGFGANAIASRAAFSIEASNDSGLLVGGRVALEPEGVGGQGLATIHAYLLIELLNPASIQIRDLVSSISSAGAQGFSLSLFQSDAFGAVHGEDLIPFSGTSTLGWDGSHSSETQGFYLLQATAHVEGSHAAYADFAFRLDIAEFVPIPEPSPAMLLLSLLTGFAFSRWVTRRNRLFTAFAAR